MNATSELNRGHIIYIEVEGYDEELSGIISKITGYDVLQEKYLVDDIKVVYNNKDEYELVENYKVDIACVKARYKTVEEMKEAMPHLFL